MSDCFWVRRGSNEFYGFDPPEGREKILYKMVCGQDPAAWIETHGVDGADYPEMPNVDDTEPEVPDDVVVIGVTDLTDAGSDDWAVPPDDMTITRVYPELDEGEKSRKRGGRA